MFFFHSAAENGTTEMFQEKNEIDLLKLTCISNAEMSRDHVELTLQDFLLLLIENCKKIKLLWRNSEFC